MPCTTYFIVVDRRRAWRSNNEIYPLTCKFAYHIEYILYLLLVMMMTMGVLCIYAGRADIPYISQNRMSFINIIVPFSPCYCGISQWCNFFTKYRVNWKNNNKRKRKKKLSSINIDINVIRRRRRRKKWWIFNVFLLTDTSRSFLSMQRYDYSVYYTTPNTLLHYVAAFFNIFLSLYFYWFR